MDTKKNPADMSNIRADWIKGKRAKTLRASIVRESLQLKKLTSSFENMKLLNDNHIKHTQRKVEGNLEKLKSVSTSRISSVSKKPNNDNLSKTEFNEQENSETNLTSLPIPMSSNHLLKFFNLPQQTSKRLSNTGNKGKNYVPFSKTDLTKIVSTSRPPNALPRMSYEPSTPDPYKGRSSSLRWRSQDPSYLSIPNAITTFPSVHRLSMARLQYGTESGCLDFEKRVKEIAIKAWEEEEKLKRSTNLPNIQPNEFLNCRYLRLSKNNIETLLQQCKDSGSQIDIHPHMKETDIDINTLIFPEKQNTVSFTDASCP